MTDRKRRFAFSLLVTAFALVSTSSLSGGAPLPRWSSVDLRGHPQIVWLYGKPGGLPVIVSSGDGGWIHLGPHVAELLAAAGFFVVGVDVRAYLSSFTTSGASLDPGIEPQDYRQLVEFASAGSHERPLLIGVSEGAGLSVLAAADGGVRDRIAGVVGLGLPDKNELGWRWRDAIVYLTHRTPREPLFRTSDVIGRLAPVPVAEIHSTHDEYVPLAEVERVLRHAGEPRRLWVVAASDHRFSDNQEELDRRLLEAVAWVRSRGLDQAAAR